MFKYTQMAGLSFLLISLGGVSLHAASDAVIAQAEVQSPKELWQSAQQQYKDVVAGLKITVKNNSNYVIKVIDADGQEQSIFAKDVKNPQISNSLLLPRGLRKLVFSRFNRDNTGSDVLVGEANAVEIPLVLDTKGQQEGIPYFYDEINVEITNDDVQVHRIGSSTALSKNYLAANKQIEQSIAQLPIYVKNNSNRNGKIEWDGNERVIAAGDCLMLEKGIKQIKINTYGDVTSYAGKEDIVNLLSIKHHLFELENFEDDQAVIISLYGITSIGHILTTESSLLAALESVSVQKFMVKRYNKQQSLQEQIQFLFPHTIARGLSLQSGVTSLFAFMWSYYWSGTQSPATVNAVMSVQEACYILGFSTKGKYTKNQIDTAVQKAQALLNQTFNFMSNVLSEKIKNNLEFNKNRMFELIDIAAKTIPLR